MSVMTAGEQRRRAGAARGHRTAAAVPGQPNVTAGPWPGAGTLAGRPVARRPMAGRETARRPLAGRPAAGQVPAGGARAGRPTAGQPSAGGARAGRALAGRATEERLPAGRATEGRLLAGTATAARPPAGWSTAGWPEQAGTRRVRTRTRLTRRGRIVVAALITMAVVLVAALAWLAGTAKADAAGSGVPSSAVYHSLRSVVVEPGQSLWSIATRYDPAADPRDVIQQIVDLNALSGTSVQPGQHLWLPRG